MSSLPSLTFAAAVPLIVVSILVGSPFAIASAQQAPLTQQEQEEANRMYSVQKLTTQYLEEGDKMIDGVIFTPRWGNVVFVEPGSLSVIFANCLPGEFAVSSQKILGGSDLNVLESYGMATPKPNDFMMWLMVVENLNETNKLPASAGVICVSDRDIDVENPASTIILSPEFNQQVSNIVNNFIKIENKQIINLQQITNVYQQITQTAIQIAIGGGNVTQIINQSASQIAASNGTNVSQIINQTASQTAAAPPASNATNVNQTIGQAANQTAAVGVTSDTTPPVISVPEDITEEATGPGGAQVSFQVSAQDDVDGPVDVSCNHNSGDTFPIGDTEVECSATDAAGNTGTESFTVTVNSPAGNEGTTSPPSSNDTDT